MIYRWFLKSGSNSAVRLNTIDKRLDRCEINGLSQYTQLGFRQVQTDNGRLFVCGGQGNELSLTEIVINESSVQFLDRCVLKYKRLEHSICAVESKMLVVTGSGYTAVERKCEVYDCEKDEWTVIPSLNQGRERHSSCQFGESQIYVFCGGSQGADGSSVLMNSIEVYDLNN